MGGYYSYKMIVWKVRFVELVSWLFVRTRGCRASDLSVTVAQRGHGIVDWLSLCGSIRIGRIEGRRIERT